MRIAIDIASRRYTGGTAADRRSLWISFTIGRRTWWLNRHSEAQLRSQDDRRLPEPRSPMCWRVGTFTTEVAT